MSFCGDLMQKMQQEDVKRRRERAQLCGVP